MRSFFETLKIKYDLNLDDQQKAAVTNIKGPVLVLAGPGSGKTTVITARTYYLISEVGIDPSQILTVTFNKAAQLEMKNRYNKIFAEELSKRATFSTLHSFCFSVIRDYERKKNQRFTLIEGRSGEDALSKSAILKDLYRDVNKAAINEDELESLINEIGYVKGKLIKNFDGIKFKTPKLEIIYRAYEKFKKSRLLIDFDDMLTYCLVILRKCPDILFNYKSRYKYFQVDEAQDLSKVQFEILKLLCSSEENNLFIVADDDQSIYGFRGAEPRYILELKKVFNNIKIYKLENNYRSSKNIVTLSSNFIKNNTNRFDKAHKTNNSKEYEPELISVEDEIEQLNFITDNIKKYLRHNLKIAILYRNNLSSIPIVERLSRQNIYYKLRQNRVHFFQHWLVKDIIAFLQFALNPCDYDAFFRICFKMNRYISKAMAENAINTGQDIPVIQCIIKTNELKPFQVTKFNELIKEFKSLAKMRPLRALKYIEEDFKYFGSVKDYCDRTGNSIDHLYSLFGILKTISVSTRSITEFLTLLEELRLKFEEPNPLSLSKGENPVSLITLHSSKGLEFDVIFMVGLTNNEIPGEKALPKSCNDNDESQIEEERRLFYVGMTRAKSRLYLIYPKNVNDKRVMRSIFLNEIMSLLNAKIHDQVCEGKKIKHEKYGEGIIVAIFTKSGRSLIEVDFKGIVKTLDLNMCIDNKIIKLY